MSDPLMSAAVRWTDPDTGRVWERSGACNHCGSCCDGCPIAALVVTDTATACTARESAFYALGCNVWPENPQAQSHHPRCSYVWTEIVPEVVREDSQ